MAHFNALPVSSLRKYRQADMQEMPRRSHAHHLKTAFTGIVRGSIRPNELHFDGPWIRVQERLDIFNDHTRSRWGVHEIVAPIRQDNNQRFLIAGAEDDLRASYYNQPVYRLWVRAAHGHNIKLSLDDKDIAVRWLTLVSAESGPLAPYKGRPCIPIDEVPPRLYHRTVEDAAFSILDDKLIPGCGSSGKAHCYFSSLPLEEMANQAGVRRDVPVKVVFETALPKASCAESQSQEARSCTFGTQAPATDAAELMDDTSPTQVVAVVDKEHLQALTWP